MYCVDTSIYIYLIFASHRWDECVSINSCVLILVCSTGVYTYVFAIFLRAVIRYRLCLILARYHCVYQEASLVREVSYFNCILYVLQ